MKVLNKNLADLIGEYTASSAFIYGAFRFVHSLMIELYSEFQRDG